MVAMVTDKATENNSYLSLTSGGVGVSNKFLIKIFHRKRDKVFYLIHYIFISFDILV